VLGKSSKCLVVLLPFLVLTAASATPTVSKCSVADCAMCAGSDVHISTVPEVPQIAGPSDSHLARAAAEFLKPPPAFTGSPALPVGARSLPAVPGALLMALTGFLCVSLVKDRKVWLAALAGLLWLGQAGIQAVPQLALRLSHRTHSKQQFSTKLTYPYYLKNSNRLRSDIEGTRYIGLLHHLAGIPHGTMSFLQPCLSFLQPRLSFLRKQESRKLTTQPYYRLNPSKNTNSFPSPSAIISQRYSLNALLNCLTLRVEQFICFSPAFIFAELPRGPPEFA